MTVVTQTNWRAGILGSILLAGCLWCETTDAAPSSLPREDFWVTDGPVRAIVETNGAIYIGGRFEYISRVSETGHAFDRGSGATLLGFPKFAGAIKTILSDGNGGWFVGGQFTAAGDFAMTNLAHVHADLTLDTNWTPHPDGAIRALAREGPRLFVGGTFEEIGGERHTSLAALDVTNGTPLAWRADCTGSLPSVNALLATNGVLYVSGYFSYINGTNREHIGAVRAGTGEVTDWFPNDFSGAQIGSSIDVMAIAGDILYIGGTFASIGGNAGPSRPFLAALDVTRPTNNIVSWNPGANGPVTGLAVECDTVYIAGTFTQVAGRPRRHLAAVAINTGELRPWNPDADGDVLALVSAGNTIYVGGKFTHIGGQPRNFVAAIETDSGAPTFWNPRADFAPTVAVGGGVVISGGVLGPGGKLRKNAAAFDARTGLPLAWAPDVSGNTSVNAAPAEGIYAIAASRKVVYLGGPFRIVNGEERNHIAAVDVSTGSNSVWNPNINGIVHALAVHRNLVYVGGQFNDISGVARTNLAALSASTGLPTKWNPGANNKVTAIVRNGSTVYVGGFFTRLGKVPRDFVGALNATTGRPTVWDPEANDGVSALAVSRARVYLSGAFSEINGETRPYLAEVTRTRPNVTCWSPEPQLLVRGRQRTPAINALTLLDGVIYAGGSFTLIARESRSRVAGLSPQCPVAATAWAPDLDDTVNAIAAARRSLAAGGSFTTVNGRYRPNFAVFPPEGAPTIVDHPFSKSAPIGASITLTSSAAGGGSLSYQWQFNGANIDGAIGPTLNLDNLQPEDSGDYVLVVTNSLGLIHSRPATVEVLEPLSIVSQPTSQTVPPGGNVVLRVEATGRPLPIYQWRLNGVNIPGAVNPTYAISNAAPQHGGSYEVLVANADSAIQSEVATVIVTSPALVFSDAPSDAVVLATTSGQGSGSNAGATSETNELHAGKVGGSSVWVSWTAPSDGVAVFNTRGSSFDTLIGVYAPGTNGSLGEVASDDDAGGFHTSQAVFNAVAGTNYLIAIDGLAGATGQVVLTWTFEPGAPEIVRFTTQPSDQSVFLGETVTIVTTVASASPVTYQWFKNCDGIPGATNATFTLSNVTFDDVGNYRVIAVNASAHVTESATASLEIGPVPNAFSHDKLEDLLAIADAEDASEFSGLSKAVRPTAFVSVTAGTIASQRFNNTRATTHAREPLICGKLGGASKWFGLRAKTNGMIVIDTIGSGIDTLLSAYRRTHLLALAANLLQCDDNSAPDGLRSVISFAVTNGQDILVTIDGANGQQGRVVLNWKLTNEVAGLKGGRSTPASARPISASRLADAPSISAGPRFTASKLRVSVAGTDQHRLVLESSTNLIQWTSIYTNPPQSPPAVLDLPIDGTPQRFFRAVR